MMERRLSPVLIGSLLSLGISTPTIAQLLPDNTLGDNDSIVNQNVTVRGALGDRIEGGVRRQSNLFHSFREFNVEAGQRVYFRNPSSVDTILTRVTGTNQSNILGTLGVDGDANLFLMNPNGIYFGEDARLDVSGSFVATTADTIQLGNGEFSSRQPQPPAQTLTVAPSAFLFNQLNQTRGNITVESGATDPNDLTPSANGLSVPDGQSLILLGGDVMVDGGYLRSQGGRIELGGLDEPGTVALRVSQDNRRLRLTFPDGVARSNVMLTNEAIVDVTGRNQGDLFVNAANITVDNGSNICAGLGASTFCDRTLGTPAGSEQAEAGNIFLSATDTVLISGDETGVRNRVNPDGIGNQRQPILDIVAGLNDDSDSSNSTDSDPPTDPDADDPIDVLYGSILVSGTQVTIADGAQLGTTTEGQGNAGLVFILTEDLTVSNRGIIDSNVFGVDREDQAGGILVTASGDILVNAGSSIESGTTGLGDAGLVSLIADTVTIDSSRLTSAVFSEGNGNAGGVSVRANTLLLTNGGYIDTSTFNQGNAGDIAVQVGNVIIDGGFDGDGDGELSDSERSRIVSAVGSEVQESPNANGEGGNILLTATGSVLIQNGGLVNASTYAQGTGGDIVIAAGENVVLSNSGIIGSAALREATGDSGRVGILAGGTVAVFDQSSITTFAAPLGSSAGNIGIVSGGALFIRNNSTVNTLGLGGDGGDLSVTSRNFVILESGGNVRTDSGRLRQRGSGGNINLDVGVFVWGIPSNDNNITAQAYDGDGGNIDFLQPIRLENIALNSDDFIFSNDITASSEFGTDGIVTINQLDVDPIRGINELPVAVINAEDLVTQECPSLGERESGEVGAFYVTGRGGLPIAPEDPSSGTVMADWIDLDEVTDGETPQPRSDRLDTDSSPAIAEVPEGSAPVEFQDWTVDENGDIWLVADGMNPPVVHQPVCP